MLKKLFEARDIMPEIETQRLLLRQLMVKDKDDMYEYACKPLVTKYLLWHEHVDIGYTEKYLRYLQTAYRRGEFFDWAITLKSSGKMIGTCGFVEFDKSNNCAEIGYVISDAYWNNGYATEAVQSIISYGFDQLGFNRIFARHIVGNTSSGKVMQKCSMKYEGTLKQSMCVKKQYRDIVIYGITRDDYYLSQSELYS